MEYPFRKGIMAVVYRGDGQNRQFLILHRIKNWIGWELSKGGVKQSETDIGAVVRELGEECSISKDSVIQVLPTNEDFVIDYPIDIQEKSGYKGSANRVFVVELVHGAKCGIDKNDEVEHDDIRWVAEKEIAKYLDPRLVKVIQASNKIIESLPGPEEPEMIAEVDDNDAVIGKIPRRTPGHGHAGGKLHREVAVIISNLQRQLLVQERADYGEYDLSVTGHVRYGEEYLDGAVRETEEELGVTISRDRFRLISKRRVHTPQFKSYRFVTLFEVAGDYRISDMKPHASEIRSLEYIEPAKLKQMLATEPKKFSPGFREMFSEYAVGKGL